MKKFFSIICFAVALVLFSPGASAQSSRNDYAGYLGVKDTLTNADTTVYEVTIGGPKHIIAVQCNVIKLTGTVAGKIDIYGSVDGVTYETALAASSVTKTDATANYVIKFTSNAYKKYKIYSIGSGTNTHSQRCYLLYRDVR